MKSELAYLGKTSPSVTWKNRLNRLESDITGWTAAFTLWEKCRGVEGSMARTSTSAGQVSPPQDENPIAAYKTFKLHPDQKEIVEA